MVAAEAVEGVDLEEDEEGEVVVEVEAVVVEVVVIRIVMREEIDPTRHTILLTADQIITLLSPIISSRQCYICYCCTDIL